MAEIKELHVRKARGPTLDAAAAWLEFEVGVRERNRVVPRNPGYFAQLIDGCLERVVSLSPGTVYYRAQIVPFEAEDSEPLPRERMTAPPPALAIPGRLNPEGIPYLYLASDRDTAVAEKRPWRGARLTVAAMTINGRPKVVDLRDLDAIPQSSGVHWAAFMLGRPVHEFDSLRYSATQLLAESLKARGAEGILYRSSMEPNGHNLALFEPYAASVGARELVVVQKTVVTYTPIASAP